MNDWVETLNAITNLVTAFATIGMLCVAGFALYTWRKEFIGKKKIELACKIMDTVCETQDALIYARMNRYSGRELKEVENFMKSTQAHDPEYTKIFPDRFWFMVPHRRLAEMQSKTDEFVNLKNKAYLYWDKEIFGLFNELYGYVVNVLTAAMDLYYNDTQKNPDDLVKILFDTGSDDPITKRINQIVEEFRINLEPIYKDQRTPWKKLKKKT
jgi:hypothetical protein